MRGKLPLQQAVWSRGAQGRCIMPLFLSVPRSFRTPVLFILRGCGLMRNDEGREAAEWVGIHMLLSTGNPLLLYTQTHTDTHLSSCPSATSLRKALQCQCAMSSLCQHILYPRVNVTEYNQSPEQPVSAEQWKKQQACSLIFCSRLLPHLMVACWEFKIVLHCVSLLNQHPLVELSDSWRRSNIYDG